MLGKEIKYTNSGEPYIQITVKDAEKYLLIKTIKQDIDEARELFTSVEAIQALDYIEDMIEGLIHYE